MSAAWRRRPSSLASILSLMFAGSVTWPRGFAQLAAPLRLTAELCNQRPWGHSSAGPRSKASSVAAAASRNPFRIPQESPYDVIGVPQGADKSEVRALFRKRAQAEHPDVNPDNPEAAENFQELVAAYNAIMGDELLPDEMMFDRVQQTPGYKKKMRKEMSTNNGIFFALLPGIVIIVLGVGYLISDFLGLLDPQTKEMVKLIKGGNSI
ncbi:unnamed protein product [Polarella glacialis]|uniref:J domain-containing protein n=1 Tax=Polarella glacialis TaxID=89957 RepID=A0A813JID4_POLGL|nr:unnamed protein product [Polarella glacialis]CAE8677423.1 unnamed protein product [Polarella glacialis]|mmetsp:Transcript_39928/g.64552  ORF Transcript_39928/g.64552 Transcript_39928/m.64552 type:complete len:209 (+) Transcript_39928:71-697(+)